MINGSCSRVVILLWVLCTSCAGPAAGQVDARDRYDQYGGQSRADAASRMIVLAVQQAISSLPPTSGQSLSYTYDPETLTFAAGERLGPTAFLSAQTIGKGKTALRVAASYFGLSESFGPITYFLDGGDPAHSGYAKLGLDASAEVGLFNLSASHGLTHRLELEFNLPIVVVDAEATQSFTTQANALSLPPLDARLSGAGTREGLERLLGAGALVIRRETFNDLGFHFNAGTSAGVGRIGIGAKWVLYAGQHVRLAAAPQFFCPSPNEDEFAGPASAAIYPRIVGQVKAADFLSLHADVGYDYDFDESALRRFVWNTGASYPGKRFSLDLGIGGSEYDTPISWTPSRAEGHGERTYIITALEDNQLGTSYVDFLFGTRVRLTDRLIASGAVTVPLNDQGFRPAALGTVAVEWYF